MKNDIDHLLLPLLLLLLASCAGEERRSNEEEVYTRAVVRLGALTDGTTNAVNNESRCADVHVLNYCTGRRKNYVLRSDYGSNSSPITIEAAVGSSSRIYVIANLNRYWKATHGGADITPDDFPAWEPDLEQWVCRLTRAQIEEHKSNTTDALFLIFGKSAAGITATDSDIPTPLPIQLARLFSKVDVKLWFDPSVTLGALDMTDAQVFFSQYVPRVRPFATDGGESYIPDTDNPTEPYLYRGPLTLPEGTPSGTHSGYYCYNGNFLPPNNATSKLDATYVILEAKWNGKTAYWKGIVSTQLAQAPYRLESNVHITVTGKITGAGKERPDVTEEVSMEVTLHIDPWTVNNLNDIETGN